MDHGLPQWLNGKESACSAGKAEDTDLSPGLERESGPEPEGSFYTGVFLGAWAWGECAGLCRRQLSFPSGREVVFLFKLMPPHGLALALPSAREGRFAFSLECHSSSFSRCF